MLVGRSQELGVLNESYQQMLAGQGSVLFLTGEAGLGKTTLVHEWRKSIAPGSSLYVEAACSIPIGNVDVGALEALQPWADVIAQLQSASAIEDKSKKLDFKRLIHDSAPAWAWAIPLIGDIAHAAMETNRLVREQRGEANANAVNQQQVFQQYVNLLIKVADVTPLIILLDDMHWSDISSTSLLFYLSRQITVKTILVLCTYRPDDALSGFGGKRHPILQIKNEILRYSAGKEISLHYLDRTAIRDILIGNFPAYQTDDEFEQWLEKISDGNSLFITQFIKTLQEDGHLDESGKFTGEYDAIKIPDSALAVVEERTARLNDETKELLSYATAEGVEFTSYILEKLSDKKPMQLLKELQTATQAGVIEQRGKMKISGNHTTGVYGFSHSLFHKALYDSLLEEQKEFLHRQCFELLKVEWDNLTESDDHSATLSSKLLTHAEKCGELESAAEVALGAARAAWHNFAEAEALEMIGNVRRFAASTEYRFPPKKRETLLGDVAMLKSDIDKLRGRYDDSAKAAGDALAQYQKLQDGKKIHTALNRRADLLRLQGAFQESEAEARKTLELAQKDGDKSGEAEALTTIGIVRNNLGEYQDAIEYFTRNMEIGESLGNRGGIATMLNNIGNVYANLGEFPQAMDYHKRSLEIREAVGDRSGTATTLGNIGNEYAILGDYNEALAHHKRSLEIFESIGERSGISRLRLCLGISYRKQGNLQQGWDEIRQAGTLAAEIKSKALEAGSVCEMGLLSEAEALKIEGDARTAKVKEAVAYLEKGLSMMRQIPHSEARNYEDELERIRNDFSIPVENVS